MIDLAAVYNHLFQNIPGWSVVERDGEYEITLPDGVEKPTKAEIEQAWREVQDVRQKREVKQARKARYEKETDELLYEALAKLDLPELKEWQDKRAQIKEELPFARR